MSCSSCHVFDVKAWTCILKNFSIPVHCPKSYSKFPSYNTKSRKKTKYCKKYSAYYLVFPATFRVISLKIDYLWDSVLFCIGVPYTSTPVLLKVLMYFICIYFRPQMHRGGKKGQWSVTIPRILSSSPPLLHPFFKHFPVHFSRKDSFEMDSIVQCTQCIERIRKPMECRVRRWRGV